METASRTFRILSYLFDAALIMGIGVIFTFISMGKGWDNQPMNETLITTFIAFFVFFYKFLVLHIYLLFFL